MRRTVGPDAGRKMRTGLPQPLRNNVSVGIDGENTRRIFGLIDIKGSDMGMGVRGTDGIANSHARKHFVTDIPAPSL